MSYSCYKTGDNKYPDCPPRMADGRHFTDFRPNCAINNMMRVQNKIVNSYEYRMFLTRNAEDIMAVNNQYAVDKNACKSCDQTQIPEQTKVDCGKESCNTLMNDPQGLGQGRVNSNLTYCDNCPSEMLNRSQVDNNCMTPYDTAQDYSVFDNNEFKRLNRNTAI